jgi:predicted Zn-dependent peptidase
MDSFDENYKEFRLNNGFLTALQETPTKTFFSRLRVHHSPLHEKEGEDGICHFLEHVLNRTGTEKHSVEEAEKVRDALMKFSIYTCLTETGFLVESLTEDFELHLDFISELAFNPVLDPRKVESERERILKEFVDKKSDSNFPIKQAYIEALFGEGPHTRFIDGKEEIVKNATIDDLMEFHSRGFHANNMDLIVVGGIPEDAEELVRTYFGHRPVGDGKPIKLPPVRPLEKGVVIHTSAPEFINLEDPEMSSAVLQLSSIVPPNTHDGSYAVIALSSIMDRRLLESISEEKGLVYYIGADYGGSRGFNRGYIEIICNVISSKRDEVISAIFDEINKFKTELVEQKELERIRRGLKFGQAKLFEQNETRVGGIELKLDTGITFNQYCERIGEVTAESIRDVARSYLPSSLEDGNYILLIRDPLLEEDYTIQK